MKKFIVILLFIACKSQKNEWVSLIKNNSLDGWHYFQDDGLKKGWSVEDGILIFDKISGLELTETLNNYAQTGSEYTKILNQIIKQNRLTDFEPVRLVNSVKKIELTS